MGAERRRKEEGGRKFPQGFQEYDVERSWWTGLATLCLSSCRAERRATLGKKQISSNKRRGGGGGRNPSAHAGVPPARSGLRQRMPMSGRRSSRKHDLGWNNPFGKGPPSLYLVHIALFSLWPPSVRPSTLAFHPSSSFFFAYSSLDFFPTPAPCI